MLLLKLWNKKKKEYYLGEWHYHPTSNIKISNADIQQMQSISQDMKINCPEPILLIIGKDNRKQNNLKAFIFPRNEKYIILKEYI